MVVAIGKKRLHRQDTVGALAFSTTTGWPHFCEPFGEQPGGHVHAAAGPSGVIMGRCAAASSALIEPVRVQAPARPAA